MKTQVVFVQGGGKDVHDTWDDKLAHSLQRALGSGYEVRYPRMPNESDPSYASWKTVLENELERLQEGAILVGHSIGGTILINALAEYAPKHAPGGVFLVSAPFVGQGGWPSDEIRSMSDLGTRLPAQLSIRLYYGTNDAVVPAEHVGLYEKAIPQAKIRRCEGSDHQLNNDLSEVAADVRELE